jgi:glycosyltransferase involved in cell wall biosynthesis
MMRIAALNISDYGSTGKIMSGIAEEARKQGHEVRTFSRNWFGTVKKEGHCFFGLPLEHAVHHAAGYLTGDEGSGSVISTLMLINELKRFSPDVIHIHNLHGWYVNLPLLFSYIKKHKIKTVWTLHDCWAFTGHCPYFDYTGCEKWKDGCRDCPSYKSYPSSLFDNSYKMYRRKKSWFTGVEDLVLVCPSRWLAGLAKRSFLGDYPVEVIHNGIDTDTFSYRESSFRADHGISADEIVVLGVAMNWEKRKGADVFPQLEKALGTGYRTVLVGTNGSGFEGMSENTVFVPGTSDQTELAEIYSAADVFVNPSREDNYPTVNLEAICCGTPAVVFDTGGSPEAVCEGNGAVVAKDDISGLAEAVKTIINYKEDRYNIGRNASETFDVSVMADSYLRLLEGETDV